MKSDQKPLKRKEKREATKAVDENLNKIRSNVSALRSMVLEMDTETDGKLPLFGQLFIYCNPEQNDMLERINKKAKDNERRLQQTTDNAKLILDSNKPCKLMWRENKELLPPSMFSPPKELPFKWPSSQKCQMHQDRRWLYWLWSGNTIHSVVTESQKWNCSHLSPPPPPHSGLLTNVLVMVCQMDPSSAMILLPGLVPIWVSQSCMERIRLKCWSTWMDWRISVVKTSITLVCILHSSNYNDHWLGMSIWSRKKCGNDFVDKVADGTIQFDILDKYDEANEAGWYQTASQFSFGCLLTSITLCCLKHKWKQPI